MTFFVKKKIRKTNIKKFKFLEGRVFSHLWKNVCQHRKYGFIINIIIVGMKFEIKYTKYIYIVHNSIYADMITVVYR